jgi:hypothetical protein
VSHQETYPVSIPSVALVLMAAELATKRKTSCCFIRTAASGTYFTGVERHDAERYPGKYPASAEHYRIIDRLARGEQP